MALGGTDALRGSLALLRNSYETEIMVTKINQIRTVHMDDVSDTIVSLKHIVHLVFSISTTLVSIKKWHDHY